MKILTNWLRTYVAGVTVDDYQLAHDLTLRGIAVEGVHSLGDGNGHLFEMDITTNRVDAMNHYGIAREAATIYDLPLEPFPSFPSAISDRLTALSTVEESFEWVILYVLFSQGPSLNDKFYAFCQQYAPGLTEHKGDWKHNLRARSEALKLNKRFLDSTPLHGSNKHKWFLTYEGRKFALEAFGELQNTSPFPVRIEAPELCGRFTARVLRNVTIAPSKGEIARYFSLLGQKQISNAVDASNFVLLGMGHPTHAFDLDKIEGGIVVRLAVAGERIKLLDGTERTLHADDLVVADERKALGLAGVMGGWDSMITPETKNILVEAAWFDPASVRRSARRHGLHTDASHRFERGADFDAAPVANALVSRLILESGGHVEGDLIDIVIPEAAARTSQRPPISLSVSRVKQLLGKTVAQEGITRETVAQYLGALGCKLEIVSLDVFAAKLPSWRLDLEREIDLIEEVARVYGYNRFANTLPGPGIVIAQPTAAAEAAVKSRLLALGYSESISSTFCSQAESAAFQAPASARQGTIPIENPLSEEATLLRPTLVPGMLKMMAHNLNRDVRDVRLFEQGTVFTGTTDAVREAQSLSLGLTGPLVASSLYAAADAAFFELKGVVESLLSLFDHAGLAFKADAPPWLEPGSSATAWLGETVLASFGELRHNEREARKLRQPVYLAEIDLAYLLALPLKRKTARELSRFPAVERDFSFVFEDAMPWETIAGAIERLAIPELRRLAPQEIFRDRKGKTLRAGSYAILLRCVFQSNERTLREEELTAWWTAIIAALTTLGGTIRDGQ